MLHYQGGLREGEGPFINLQQAWLPPPPLRGTRRAGPEGIAGDPA